MALMTAHCVKSELRERMFAAFALCDLFSNSLRADEQAKEMRFFLLHRIEESYTRLSTEIELQKLEEAIEDELTDWEENLMMDLVDDELRQLLVKYGRRQVSSQLDGDLTPADKDELLQIYCQLR
jgi:hypothetical protein